MKTNSAIKILFFVVLLSCLFVCNMVSCDMGVDGLDVCIAYEGKVDLSPSPDGFEAVDWSSLHPYNHDKIFYCELSVANGELRVEKNYNCDPSRRFDVIEMNNGYFAGVSLAWDGWLAHYPYHGSYEISGESELISHQDCMGFIKVDNDNAYAFTYDRTQEATESGETHGYVYKLTVDTTTHEYSVERLARFDGAPCSFALSESGNDIYISTYTSGLIRMTLDGSTERLVSGEQWEAMVLSSTMVELDGKLYVGACMGVFEYDIVTGKSVWYPMYEIDDGTVTVDGEAIVMPSKH